MHDDVLLISFTIKPHIQNANVSQRTATEKNTSMEVKKRAETTWERGVVVKLISKTSSCITLGWEEFISFKLHESTKRLQTSTLTRGQLKTTYK